MNKFINPYDDLLASNYQFRTPYHPKFMDELFKIVNLEKNAIPLDLLCGRGEISEHLSRHCKFVIGVDGSKDMLSRAKPNTAVQYLCGDVNSPDFIQLFNGQKFSHCFIGRAVKWINQDSLIQLKESIFTQDIFLITMEGGFSKRNEWIPEYRRIINSFTKPTKNKIWVSDDKRIINSGFKKITAISGEFMMKVDIEFLIGNALSYSSRAHQLASSIHEFKSVLTNELRPFCDLNGNLSVIVSNSGVIFQSY